MRNIIFFEVKINEEREIRKYFPDAYIFHRTINEEIQNIPKDAEIFSVMVHSKINKEIFDSFPKLKMIATRSVGYDHIDLKEAQKRNIIVTHVPDYGSHVIAEHVFALLLASVRRVLEGEAETEKGKFEDEGLMGMSLKGKTIGVIGTGKIGAHVCRIASHGFLMNVLAYDVFPREELAEEYHFHYVSSLDEIYSHSDIITLHVPLLDSTRHMINNESIQKMKDGVVLINTSRGGLICTKDLISWIKKEKFSHVALDVIEHEENLEKEKELLHLPGVIITPHIAYYTRESVENMYRSTAESILQFLRGEKIINRVIGE